MARSHPNTKAQRVSRGVMITCGVVLLLIGANDRGGFFLSGSGLGMLGWAIWGLPWQWRRAQRERS